MISVSADQSHVITALLDAVKEKGEDYIYDSGVADNCHYLTYADDAFTEPTGPSCIVGYALLNSGLATLDSLREMEGTTAINVAPWGTDDEVSIALNEAQVAQDMGEPWGDARNKFIASLEDQGVDLSWLEQE